MATASETANARAKQTPAPSMIFRMMMNPMGYARRTELLSRVAQHGEQPMTRLRSSRPTRRWKRTRHLGAPVRVRRALRIDRSVHGANADADQSAATSMIAWANAFGAS